MTIDEAQELVEVWNLKHPATPNASSEASSPCATEQKRMELGEQFWELLSTADREQVNLTEALCEMLHRRNAK